MPSDCASVFGAWITGPLSLTTRNEVGGERNEPLRPSLMLPCLLNLETQ